MHRTFQRTWLIDKMRARLLPPCFSVLESIINNIALNCILINIQEWKPERHLTQTSGEVEFHVLAQLSSLL